MLHALLFLIVALTMLPVAAAPAFERIEAVRSDWNATTPPADGWVPVTLPDGWAGRWPDFDGVVWYRLRWQQADTRQPVGLLLDYVVMAGAVYLNGSLLGRDAHLSEPLSRAWNRPQYWVLDSPLLRQGSNELLVRVSGLSPYQPGLGAVVLGDPTPLALQYRDSELVRRTLLQMGIGLTLATGVLYGMLWLLRRSESTYGWYSLFSLLWLPYAYNYVANEAWPYPDTHVYQFANLAFLLGSVASFVLFALRFCNMAGRQLQRGTFALTALCIVALAVAPANLLAGVRSAAVTLAVSLFLAGFGLICRHAWTSRQLEARVLALWVILPTVTCVHDGLVFLEVLPGLQFYSPVASCAMLLGIASVLTWRLVTGMRLVENFNAELRQRIDAATSQLAEVLHHQHAAALEHTRLSERLSLVRDLHDGLGMMLSGHINALQSRADSVDDTALWTLREISNDLRLLIESASLDDTDRLADRLVPLRHRSTRLLDAAGIRCNWQLRRLADCRLDGRRSLDFLRLLQEALTNVLKHSRASHVTVELVAADGYLGLSVTDNGTGFAADALPPSHQGMGLQSMRARAERLGGRLTIRADAKGTIVSMHFALDAAAMAR